MKYGKLENNTLVEYKNYRGGLSLNGYIIFNPTKDHYIQAGWYPIVDVAGEGENHIENNELIHYTGIVWDLDKAKESKLLEIEQYDLSDEVNGFNLMGMTLWIPRETRVSLQNSTQILLKNGIDTTTLWEGTMHFELSCQLLLQLLDALEIYALQCFNKTAEHKANVSLLNSIEDVEAYDYTTGYPQKLTFNL